MIEINAYEKWCPFARVAMQQRNANGNIETVGYAYNRTFITDLPQHDTILGKAGMCLGSGCACWKPSFWNFMCYVPIIGYWWPRCGKCGR